MVSINTNPQQTSALQLLARNEAELSEIRSRLATGLGVATAKDNGAIWGMAVQADSTLSGYEVLDAARGHAEGLVDVTLSATEAVSDILEQLSELAAEPNRLACHRQVRQAALIPAMNPI